MSPMTVKDLEIVQSIFQTAEQDYRLELDEGKITVMSPSDLISSEVGVLLSMFLANWVYSRKLGRVFDASGGFIMPNADLKAPDLSFVLAARLPRNMRSFGELVPDLVVEIKSQSDRPKTLEKKIKKMLSMGAQVGLLVNPDTQTVTIYQATGEVIEIRNGEILTLPKLLPGWELAIAEIWPPIFEED